MFLVVTSLCLVDRYGCSVLLIILLSVVSFSLLVRTGSVTENAEDVDNVTVLSSFCG